jgi:hypothetical protein
MNIIILIFLYQLSHLLNLSNIYLFHELLLLHDSNKYILNIKNINNLNENIKLFHITYSI